MTMKIGDRCFVHGYVDEIRKDTVIVRNSGGYFGTAPGEVIVANNTDAAIEAKSGEVADEAYKRGYETGFAEGRKQADDEIRVGDEVVYHAQFKDYTGFVIEVKSAYLLKLMLIDGSIWSVKRSNVGKTGRNLQMVEKLLEAMKE